MSESLSLAEMVAADAKPASTTQDPPKTDITPVESETQETVEEEEIDDDPPEDPAGEPGDTTENLTVRDYIKDIFPDSAGILEKYKDDDEFLKGAIEAMRMVGRRSEESKVVQSLREAGITPDDLQQLIDLKKNPKPQQTTTATDVEWDPDWVMENERHELVPTAKGKRIPDIADKIEAYQSRVREALRDPRKLAELMKPYIASDKDATSAKVAELEVRLAQEAYERERTAWTEQHKDICYADGKLTPVGSIVDEYLNDEGFYPTSEWSTRADKALKIAIAQKTPTPTTRKVPTPAKRQAPVAPGTKTKLTDDQFFEKYRPSIKEFDDWVQKGTLPTR